MAVEKHTNLTCGEMTMKRYPILSFFLLTFGITWGLGGLYVLFPSQMEAAFGEVSFYHPLFFLATYAPALSALIVIGVTQGVAGLSSYLRRLLHWRVGVRGYLLVLFGIPTLYLCSTLISVALGTGNPPTISVSPWYMVVPVALSVLVMDPGAMEEIGWRGFALPLLQSRFSALWSSLVLGSIWAIWHLPSFFISGLPHNSLEFPPFLLSQISWAILMTAIYNRTGGSIPLMFLFHWQINVPFHLGDMQRNFLFMALLLAALAFIVTVVSGPRCLAESKYTEAVPRVPKAA
jgi:uncharacterized protein